MGSLPDEVLVSDLEIAFNSFYQYRRAKIGFSTSSRDFDHALKELDGNFVKTKLIGRDQIITFHNPSVSDFIEGYLADSPTDVLDLIEGAAFFDQFMHLWRGQRGKRFSGVDRHSATFVHIFARQFSSPTCRIIRLGDGSGHILGVRQWDLSFEARTLFALELANGLKTPETDAVMHHLLSTLRTRIELGSDDKDGLVRLLQALDSPASKSDATSAIVAAAANYLTKDLEDLDDFSSVGKFVESFPSAIVAAELDRIRRVFAGLCETYDDSWANDPEDLRGVAEDFDRVGSQLKVDVDTVYGNLIRRAEDWESDRRESPDEPEDSDDEWRGHQIPSENIDLMFESLLREIDEEID